MKLDCSDRVITIRENPMYNVEFVLEKIQKGVITKLARRHKFEPGIYRLKKELNNKKTKLLDEHIVVKSVKKVLWITLTNDEAKEILGTDKPPLFGSYLHDLRKYWSRHDMAMQNVPYIYLHEISYVKKPVQTKLI